MPKQIYGHKNARRRARAPEEDSSIWLTLISELPEGKRHAAIIEALREGPRLDPNQLDSLAAALVEYADDRRADCDEAWVGVLLELFADFGVVLGVEEDVEDADGAERAGAFELLRALRRHKVLCSEPPPPPPLAQGVQVLAVLDEDGEWHDAVVERVAVPISGVGPTRVVVRFAEWQKVQECARSKVVQLTEVPDDDDEGARDHGEGECELCERYLKLTFHHLIPKETHGRYLGKALPSGVAEAAAAGGADAQPTRYFLNSYGSMLCRFCHSTVHRLAPNAVLAERFNTLARLQAQPDIQRFVTFAARQRTTRVATKG